jgi:CheY-like chemotaxis protein
MAQQSRPEGAPRHTGLSVLVVEDEEDLRDAIRYVLSSGGCSVDTAASGAEALRHVLGREYHVVISEFHPPHINGIELARLLTRRIRSPRVIIITTFTDSETVREAYAAGASEFLAKPLSLMALSRAVTELGTS